MTFVKCSFYISTIVATRLLDLEAPVVASIVLEESCWRCSLGFNRFALGHEKHNACIAKLFSTPTCVHGTLLVRYWIGEHLVIRRPAFLAR